MNKWRKAEPGEVNTRKQTRQRRKLQPEIEVDGLHLVTIRRAAEIANVAVSTVYRWIQDGYIPHYRRGYWLRVDRKSLEGI
jgi:excisionase family DNA binding protein